MRRTGNRGQVLLVFLAGLLALLGVAALGIDVGYLYTVRHELQRSTDAGALAGASAFLSGNWTEGHTRAVANSRARAYASMDIVATTTLSAGSEVDVTFPGPDRVRVVATRNVPLFFANLFLGATRTVTAYSIAEASVVNNSVIKLQPWGIPYPWEDPNGNGLYDPGETVHRDCPNDVLDPSRYFCPGTRVILKIGTPQNSPNNPTGLPSLQQEPGHFFSLAIDGTGGSVYRDTIANGSQNPISVGDAITLEPGDKVGPTRQGTIDLMNADGNSRWNESLNLPESDLYHAEDGSWMNSPRVVRIPIYDPEVALVNGRTDMVVAGFAGFWIEDFGPQGTIIGRFVPMKAVGQPGGSAGPNAGPVLKTLRLVE